MWITLLASIVGSAWVGLPFARSQVAHSSSSWVGLPLGSVVVVAPASPLLLPRFATCGELPPPPHAANPNAASAAAAVRPPDRQYLVFTSRLPPALGTRMGL